MIAGLAERPTALQVLELYAHLVEFAVLGGQLLLEHVYLLAEHADLLLVRVEQLGHLSQLLADIVRLGVGRQRA